MKHQLKISQITEWLDATLNVAAYADDVSNNGLQIARSSSEAVTTVAFAVDASVRAVEAAAAVGAQLLVVHHGFSWGGGVKRLTGGVYNVVSAAMKSDLAIYACHLPLDAHPTLGNNARIAKLLGLRNLKPSFNYHGHVIGLVGEVSLRQRRLSDDTTISKVQKALVEAFGNSTVRIGVCSGGAGSFAEDAKRLGCDVYLTGEADWGEVIAAENCGMRMICAGHYDTEVFGVRAVSEAMGRSVKVKVVDLTDELRYAGVALPSK